MAEHLPHKQGVVGSSPAPASTMIETFVFSWYLLLADGGQSVVKAGSVQTEDRQECEAARHDKSIDLSQKVASKAGDPMPGSGWLVGACRRE